MPVQSTDDGEPRLSVRDGCRANSPGRKALTTQSPSAYTPDAGELVSHVFRSRSELLLGHLWLRPRFATLLRFFRKDRQVIVDATAVRLASADPCPARILEGRVRTLPDLNVALLEVVRSRDEELNYEGDRSAQNRYGLSVEGSHSAGSPRGLGPTSLYRYTVPWSLPSRRERLNPIRPSYAKSR